MTPAAIPAWLGRFSDPAGENAVFDAISLRMPLQPASIDALVAQSAAHGTVMALYRNIAALAKAESPELALNGDRSGDRANMLVSALHDAFLAHLARNMELQALAQALTARIDADGLPARVIKGLDFADNVYGGIQVRPFSDVDILTAPEAMAELHEILADLGFTAVTPNEKREAYSERQFGRPRHDDGYDLVELHTDLVHAPKLRRSMTLTYADYADPGLGGISMAARLILASLHGASSHLFDRLQYVVDILMIVRAGANESELADRVRRAGAETPVRTGLHLAQTLFASERCGKLRDSIPPRPGDALAARLVDGRAVLLAQSDHRCHHSWRRQLYRLMLASQSPPSAA